MPPVNLPPIIFPAVHTADASGLVAIGHALDADLLMAAYAQGIFPWHDNPVGWYAPDPRAVFHRDAVHLPHNLGKLMRRAGFTFTFDRAFAQVVAHCADAHRAQGIWITPHFAAAYCALHLRGHAHSVEVWQGPSLVGGLYGVQIGGLFAGESMFHRVDNASKAAFWALWRQLDAQKVVLCDAQAQNSHIRRLGAIEIPRAHYMRQLAHALTIDTPGSGAAWPAGLP